MGASGKMNDIPKSKQCGELGPGPGDELCDSCKSENETDSRLIAALIEQGHAEHCAKRQIYGDGECECDSYKKGYNPYAWSGDER